MLKEKGALGGAVVAALVASLCCIGPLLFVLFGVGAFGAATYFDAARPYLMAVAVLLLAVAYYWTYFRRAAACAPGEACETKPDSRAGRMGLWLATFAVILFSIIPYIVPPLAARLSAGRSEQEDCCVARKPPAPNAANNGPIAQDGDITRATFTVKGMTCASCETTIKLALERTPGVKSAEVSYDRSEAVVDYDPNVVTTDRLRSAINSTGYTCELPK
jgi:mercuric ion transport protein